MSGSGDHCWDGKTVLHMSGSGNHCWDGKIVLHMSGSGNHCWDGKTVYTWVSVGISHHVISLANINTTVKCLRMYV